jgi:hypothetical protein
MPSPASALAIQDVIRNGVRRERLLTTALYIGRRARREPFTATCLQSSGVEPGQLGSAGHKNGPK